MLKSLTKTGLANSFSIGCPYLAEQHFLVIALWSGICNVVHGSEFKSK